MSMFMSNAIKTVISSKGPQTRKKEHYVMDLNIIIGKHVYPSPSGDSAPSYILSAVGLRSRSKVLEVKTKSSQLHFNLPFLDK